MNTWRDASQPPFLRLSLAARLFGLLRGLLLGTVVFGGLAVLLVVRLLERPVFGLARPLTPWITQGVCRAALVILGIRYRVSGRALVRIGAVVANHSSWLDIFALNACQRVYFVAKSEVAGWAGIGWLARATGTVFIRRDPREARAQKALFETRLRAGHHLLFFPEGTSTDGRRVLPFKSTLFSAFFSASPGREMWVLPISLIYRAPEGADPRFYGWWADMELAPHLMQVLARWRQGEIEVVFHEAVRVEAFESRKALAAHCERAVRSALPFA
ncbi:lysophospholipid acyltransferase family protein [Phaeovulum sp.]|uniref:lysophospholipid acyltransferase family protein n=1 Tax=Phaeovulum sp. TaxID=2934796 RepID=UPI0035218B8E